MRGMNFLPCAEPAHDGRIQAEHAMAVFGGTRKPTPRKKTEGAFMRRGKRASIAATVLLLLCSSVSLAQPHAVSAPSAAPPDNGNWEMPGKNYASTRFSAMRQITPANVGKLALSFTFSTATTHGYEAPPLVVDGMMYLITPFPNIVYALDLTKPGAPTKWVYKPKPLAAARGVACCDVVNRGVVYSNGRIFFNTLDNRTIALEAETGKLVWETKVGDINNGESMTMAPLVVKDKVLVGNSGGEFGIRGWLTALDANTGNLAWRAYTTGPDKDVLIGSNFHPFYDSDKGKDLGQASWPGDSWRIGGGGVWGWISYDPQLDLVYYGTANPGPWNPDQRPGDNKWTTSIFARKPDNGEAIWAYQVSPHDLHDYDGVNELVLA